VISRVKNKVLSISRLTDQSITVLFLFTSGYDIVLQIAEGQPKTLKVQFLEYFYIKKTFIQDFLRICFILL